ncbi:MAG: RelA/SpoT family protein, partial [bacterium]
IALPKSNLYQSIHTKVKDEEGEIVEVQIRTHDMHTIAENGVAAHWLYKMGQVKPEAIDQRFSWVRSLLEWHKEVTGGGEFVESLKVDLLQDEIYVFTPKGDLIKLPRGATVLDFAFAIHSELGLKAIGAKMDGKVVPLSEEVTPGAVIEIITTSDHNPSAEWLKFVRTTRARNRIRRWFRETRFEEAVKLGQELLNAEAARMGLSIKEREVKETALSYGHKELEDFYYNLGMGIISIGQVIRKIVPLLDKGKEDFASMVVERVEKDGKIILKAIDNLVVVLAECCNPIPGDPIIAFQVPQVGLVVHRTDCRQIDRFLGEDRKVMSVVWDVELQDRFKARLRIIADDRPNLLRDITKVISSLKMNITRVEFHMEEKLAIGTMEIEVQNLPQLTKLMGRLNRVRGILQVERMAQPQSSPISQFPASLPTLH